MRTLLLTSAVLVCFLSASCVSTQQASDSSHTQSASWSQAVYCNVEELGICAVAQSSDDCKKLGGKKVSACLASGK